MVDTQQIKDINDIFEDILFAEEKIVEKSFEEGFEVGTKQENTEAYHLGYHRGAEIGAELGYYSSFLTFFLKSSKDKGIDLPDKVQKTLTILQDLIEKFPHDNDDNTDLKESLNNIRVKFKLFCSLVKINGNFSEGGSLAF
ncbi:protein LTO1 homolog [Coccinella septempunctata]|uniref:protein LTO1 homolog n=1 Tax=Coccinella septempunctata TaxID=41139 RepID=UPI001D0889A6|nr:protein LTO1 homolog [Coccinella septempunctata]